MHVVHNRTDRKLMAVIGTGGAGIFLRGEKDEGTIYINGVGHGLIVPHSLEGLITEDIDRTPVYQGESITLTF